MVGTIPTLTVPRPPDRIMLGDLVLALSGLRAAMDVMGKVAFVSGGSGDIGRTIALALADSGSDVAISYVGEAGRAEAAVAAVRKAGRQGHVVQLDQRDPKSIDASLESVLGRFGRI